MNERKTLTQIYVYECLLSNLITVIAKNNRTFVFKKIIIIECKCRKMAGYSSANKQNKTIQSTSSQI